MLKKSLKVAAALLCTLLLLPISIGSAAKKPTVTVTTTFLADMVRELAGDAVDVETLMPAGSDPHLYQPKAQDVQKVAKADLVLYHGLHFEGKMVDVLEKYGTAVTKDFDKDAINEMEEDNTSVVDPHFWFDIKLYKQATQTASNTLQEKYPELKEQIAKNTTAYLAKLDELAKWVEKELSVLSKEQRYLVTPHDAFNYFARSYGFTVYAPQGVSTNSEVSNQQIGETVDFIIKHKIPAIFVESTTNPERMKKLQEAVKAKGGKVDVVNNEDEALFSDSLAPKGQNGDTYISMYQHNVKVIVKYLSQAQ
ncbi:zinc ABC transporter substrate-binding protein [Tuanshanicoccus lijuaniae]|uniref:metal ABC transporter solute-binding protein, Zn/Mn family n=1 Tax=Aerococcaceae bacterium zg-1292 TaxID=2774330 RepID=UPI001935EBCC|nr:zinc ABC transporter substrate-binding protein [Aerococcaceae bacterium zg-1292]MBF6625169.1 zinc ABC transporter substrate-binding protein [Aerococcaceae bacterium zg-BR9]MBF6978296.1 zinc ABC transporter substrate-binding protein [Aerococcaceae bacterium zg-BR22]MBS4456821.1 zinc ABC transporter substrate-binding protein [Aerococcaceae bacterium zg-A91]MBS4458649.1 zinc ABC transporter substrate-binding protein [Aerococcaceae bacterium zg-BR33]